MRMTDQFWEMVKEAILQILKEAKNGGQTIDDLINVLEQGDKG